MSTPFATTAPTRLEHHPGMPWAVIGPEQPYSSSATPLRALARGEALFHQGDRLAALYQVRAGQFKTIHADPSGRFQVTAFPTAGEWLGLDGIGTGRHCFDVVALESALVVPMLYDQWVGQLHASARLQRDFHQAMSREIVRNHAMLLLLGTLSAEGRVAAFVLDLAERLCGRSQTRCSLALRMSRNEIGSYLGLTLETVSRIFSKLQTDGLLGIDCRQVQLLDTAALRRVAHLAP